MSTPYQYVMMPSHATVSEALERWPGGVPEGGMLALVAESDRECVPELQRAFADAGRPLAGAVFPELIVEHAFVSGGVLLLPLPDGVEICLTDRLSTRGDSIGALAEVVGMAESHGSGRKDTLFFFFDCMVPNIGTLLDGLHLSLGNRMHYAGVNAGSETFQPIDCLFDGKRFVRDAVMVLRLPNQPEIGLAHDYNSPTEVITATASEGNRVATIDWKPAFEVYQRLIDEMYGEKVTEENFYQYAVHFPLGILRPDGEVVVRIPVGLGEEGEVSCVGEIPQNAILTLLRAVDPDVTETARHLGRVAVESSAPMIQAYYCAGRRLHLQEAARGELEELHRQLNGLPMAGALSLGEIGSGPRGNPLFHNAALVCMPWGEAGSP